LGAECRPEPSELTEYFKRYIDRVPRHVTLAATLESQRVAVSSLLALLTPQQSVSRYAPGKWSVLEVFGHIIEVERMLVYWAWCFCRGDTSARPGVNCEAYVAEAAYRERTAADIRAEYLATRAATLAFLEHLTPAQLGRTGIAGGGPMSARAALFVHAGHEAHHLEVLARHYGIGRLHSPH
jgi:hypothetical protein